MAFTDFPTQPSSWLQYECNPAYTRKEVTLLLQSPAVTLPSGRLLGKITASGKYVAHDESGIDDGHRAVAGILLIDTTVGASDVKATALVRGPAIVAQDGLTHFSGASAGQKTTNEAELDALGIKVEAGG